MSAAVPSTSRPFWWPSRPQDTLKAFLQADWLSESKNYDTTEYVALSVVELPRAGQSPACPDLFMAEHGVGSSWSAFFQCLSAQTACSCLPTHTQETDGNLSLSLTPALHSSCLCASHITTNERHRPHRPHHHHPPPSNVTSTTSRLKELHPRCAAITTHTDQYAFERI